MKSINVALMWVGLVAAGCGSKTNPNVCCTDSANCAAEGLPDDAMCTDGLICRGNQCVAETCSSSNDCEAGAPFCTPSGLCAMVCDQDSQCPGFGGSADATFCQTGACVECRDASDCDASSPICDMGTCRVCKVDADCPSGACGDNGSCTAESSILYLAPTGTDSGSCTHSTPCATIGYAATLTTSGRNQIVLANGSYTGHTNLGGAPAALIVVHANGSTLQAPPGEFGVFETGNIGLDLRDATLVGNSSAAALVQTGSVASRFEHDAFTSSSGTGLIAVAGSATLTDCTFVNLSIGIHPTMTASLTADRIVMHSVFTPIRTDVNVSTIDISNLLVYDAQAPVDLSYATGSLRFATIADVVGTESALTCADSVVVQSSIIWSPTSSTPVAGSCQMKNSIVGPTALTGSMNTNPQFKNELQRDYHLASNSPAIDLVGSGPATDYEGDARPKGAGFDIGADEAQ